MKFFLDENFPRPALAQLVSGDHSASHALDYFPPGTDDEKLFERAQRDGAIFITTDKDFFHTIPLAFARHGGAIVITLRKPNRAAMRSTGRTWTTALKSATCWTRSRLRELQGYAEKIRLRGQDRAGISLMVVTVAVRMASIIL
jgi:predicted nuclease of predicted toxin-antitoxin system